MTGEPAYIRNLRKLTRAEPQFEHLEALEKELYISTSDRATAVLFGSFLEERLRQLLTSVMRDDLNSQDRKQLFEFEGAIGSFSSRILMAYALKLIGPLTRTDLDLIRLLRNEFAHSRMSFNFQTQEVREVCEQLKIVDLPESIVPHGYLRRLDNDQIESSADKNDPKMRFISTCHNLAYRMLVKREGPTAGHSVFPNDEPLP